jgi:uncharacterized ferritin-like protein (DUF455 family)
MARLAIEHMVHEASTYRLRTDTWDRANCNCFLAGGIDVTPKTIEKFRNAKDEISATLLEEILRVLFWNNQSLNNRHAAFEPKLT